MTLPRVDLLAAPKEAVPLPPDPHTQCTPGAATETRLGRGESPVSCGGGAFPWNFFRAAVLETLELPASRIRQRFPQDEPRPTPIGRGFLMPAGWCTSAVLNLGLTKNPVASAMPKLLAARSGKISGRANGH
jgi:hypothetical protein